MTLKRDDSAAIAPTGSRSTVDQPKEKSDDGPHGLVHAEDELLAPGQTNWVRVGEHTALRAEVPARRGGPRIVGGFDLVGTVVFALAGLVGMLLGWSLWVVLAAVGAAVWFSTRVALRARPSNRVSSRRR